MLLRPATHNCGCNIGSLFRIAAAKFQNAKFKALPHSSNSNGPLPLLRVQLRQLPPLFITLPTGQPKLTHPAEGENWRRKARMI
jgi:hypothetical protein